MRGEPSDLHSLLCWATDPPLTCALCKHNVPACAYAGVRVRTTPETRQLGTDAAVLQALLRGLGASDDALLVEVRGDLSEAASWYRPLRTSYISLPPHSAGRTEDCCCAYRPQS